MVALSRKQSNKRIIPPEKSKMHPKVQYDDDSEDGEVDA
jgi:hypothetical protein